MVLRPRRVLPKLLSHLQEVTITRKLLAASPGPALLVVQPTQRQRLLAEQTRKAWRQTALLEGLRER